jgi:hypothetical protein
MTMDDFRSFVQKKREKMIENRPLISFKKRSPKISPLSPHKRSRSTNQQHQIAIAPNLNNKAIASNIHTFTTHAIAPQQTNNTKQRSHEP